MLHNSLGHFLMYVARGVYVCVMVLLGLYILSFHLSLPVFFAQRAIIDTCYSIRSCYTRLLRAHRTKREWGRGERKQSERGEGGERRRERLTGSGEGSLGGGSGLGSLSTVDRYNNRRSMMSEKPLTIDNMGYVLCLQDFCFYPVLLQNTSEYLKGRLSTYISRFQHIYTWMHTFGGGTVYLAQRRRTGDKKMAKLAVRSGGGNAQAENESVEDEREFGTNKREKQLHGG